MSDIIELRDHREPCEHPPSKDHQGLPWGAYQANDGAWLCGRCPGGKLRQYREEFIHHSIYQAESGELVTAHIDRLVLVEVTDEL